MLVLAMVLVVGGLPLFYSTRRPPLRAALLLGHVALLQMITGELAPFRMPLWPGVEVSPGNVLVVGLLMTAFVLVLVERQPHVVRAAILVVLGVSIASAGLLEATNWALSSPAFVQTSTADPALYGLVSSLVIAGDLLVVVDLLVLFVLSQRLLLRGIGSRRTAALSVAAFTAITVLDGVLFSLIRGAVLGAGPSVAAGVITKFFLAVAFSLPLFAFLVSRHAATRPESVQPLRLRDVLLLPPRRAVVERLEEERSSLLERNLHIAEDERRRLAEDLHDEAIQLLTAADIRLQLAARDAEVDLEPARELLRSGVGSLRRLILELRSPEVTSRSFTALVDAYGERLLPAVGVDLHLDVTFSDEVPPDVIAAAYRIVMEAISNVARHAEADEVVVTVSVEEGMVIGEVVDDGIGIPDAAETGPGHLGLRAMRDRADTVGGWVDVASTGDGTAVSFRLPCVVERGS